MPNLIQNLVVVELIDLPRRTESKPHLYVVRTQKVPELLLKELLEGRGPSWLIGRVKGLRPDLIPNFRPTKKIEVAEVRLNNLKIDLARRGFAINGDTTSWRIYVLDLDADIDPPIRDRGKLGKVIYVGQTTSPLPDRIRQHQGEKSKTGRYIGSRKLKGRNPTLNSRLTPSKVLYTASDAIAFETLTHKKLEKRGYRVLGDVLKQTSEKLMDS